MRPEFTPFPKIPRLRRHCVITEKIDGTNAQVLITPDGEVYAGSRTRYVEPGNDNYGFAGWVKANEEDLRKLGPGQHFGEWWGVGINRGYGLYERRFSLFNTSRWSDPASRPACCGVVPVLYAGPFTTDKVDQLVEGLRQGGSVAVPGFMHPEGVVVYLPVSNSLYKVTCERDEERKNQHAPA